VISRNSTLIQTGKIGRDITSLVSDARKYLQQALGLLPKKVTRKFGKRFDQMRGVRLALNAVSSVRRTVPLYDMNDPDFGAYTTQGFDAKIQTLLDTANSSLIELLQILREGRDIEASRSDRARGDIEKALRHLKEFGGTLLSGVTEPQNMGKPKPRKGQEEKSPKRSG